MSFQESDFPRLIEILDRIQKKYKNPALVDKVVSELVRNYAVIPLYPSLLSDTILKMIKGADPARVRRGAWITFQYGKRTYTGVVERTDKGSVTLRKGIEVNPVTRKNFPKQGLKNILQVHEGQLKEDWPMFFFKKGKK